MNDLYVIMDKESGKPLTGIYSTYGSAKYEFEKMSLPDRYEVCMYTFVAFVGDIVDDQ